MRSLFILFLIFSTALSATSWPEMPFPADVKVNLVSENMVFNGVPMRTWVMRGQTSLESTTKFYRDSWKNIEDSLYDEKNIDGWTYINSKQEGFLLTAKIGHNLGQTQAYLGISNFEDRIIGFKPGQNFLLPRGSIVINDIRESDIGKKQRYLLFSTQQSVSSTYEFYVRQLANKGWTASAMMIDPKKRDAVIALTKNGDEMNFSISKQGNRTQVNASWVEKTIL